MTSVLLQILLVLTGACLSAAATWLFSIRHMPASYRIAVLGFPQSGKTTLITAIFAYMFDHGVPGASIVPRGDETIRRVNANMQQLELGREMKPTTDQDVFAYRAEVCIAAPLLSRRYKLEIGDFPGESTVRFSDEHGPWLHGTSYFDWAIDADAFILVIDTSAVLSDLSGEYVAGQKRAFRAAWHRLKEHYLDGSADLSRRPLILVFTKADAALQRSTEAPGIETLLEARAVEEPREGLDRAALVVQTRFEDLIKYFARESRRFAVVQASIFVRAAGERLGIPQIARYVMPRPTFWPLSLPAPKAGSNA
jgi:GTPase SAR1 family protein